MNIYRALPEDLKILQKIGFESYKAHFYNIWSNDGLLNYLHAEFSDLKLCRELKDTSKYLWLLISSEQSDNIIGFARIVWNSIIPDSQTSAAELSKIYFNGGATGQGYGKKALQKIESEAVNNGSSYIWLDVLKSNVKGQKFYAANGFSTITEIPFSTDLKEIGMLVMGKKLVGK